MDLMFDPFSQDFRQQVEEERKKKEEEEASKKTIQTFKDRFESERVARPSKPSSSSFVGRSSSSPMSFVEPLTIKDVYVQSVPFPPASSGTIKIENLVWAFHEPIMKGGHSFYFPARICDESEGVLLQFEEGDWPLRPGTSLIQYLIRIDAWMDGQYKIRRTSELKPFHTNLGSRATSKFLNSRKTEEERREAEEEEAEKLNWNNWTFLETQRRIRQTPYLKRFSLNIADFKHLFDHMKRIMDSFMNHYLDIQHDRIMEAHHERRQTRARLQEEEEEEEDDFPFASKEDMMHSIVALREEEDRPLLQPGDFVLYFHKVTTAPLVSRIVELAKEGGEISLSLENGDSLENHDVVHKMKPKTATVNRTRTDLEDFEREGKAHEVAQFECQSGKVDDAISFSSLLTHDIVTMEKQMAKETGFVLNRRARQALQEETTKEKREREETEPFHPVKHRRHG